MAPLHRDPPGPEDSPHENPLTVDLLRVIATYSLLSDVGLLLTPTEVAEWKNDLSENA